MKEIDYTLYKCKICECAHNIEDIEKIEIIKRKISKKLTHKNL